MSTIAAWVGFGGVLALLGIVYAMGRKIGSIDTKIADIEAKLIDPKDFGKLMAKVDTVFDIYVIDKLKKANPHESKEKYLTEELKQLISKILASEESKDPAELTLIAVKELAAQRPPALVGVLEKLRADREDTDVFISAIYHFIEDEIVHAPA